jgi:hypothetical protein
LLLFVAAVTFLASRWQAAIGGYTDWWEEFVKYAVEMGSCAVIYIPRSMKIGSGIQKLIGGMHRHRQHGDFISLLVFFKNKEI